VSRITAAAGRGGRGAASLRRERSGDRGPSNSFERPRAGPRFSTRSLLVLRTARGTCRLASWSCVASATKDDAGAHGQAPLRLRGESFRGRGSPRSCRRPLEKVDGRPEDVGGCGDRLAPLFRRQPPTCDSRPAPAGGRARGGAPPLEAPPPGFPARPVQEDGNEIAPRAGLPCWTRRGEPPWSLARSCAANRLGDERDGTRIDQGVDSS
jgi:hypothetical protein